MARFIESAKAHSAGAIVTTLTTPNPTHAAGDLLVNITICDNASETISIDGAVSGWSVANQQTSTNPAVGVFYNRASGASEDALIADSTGSGEMSGITLCIRDTHATSVIHQVGVSSGTADDVTMPTVTTTEANAYVLAIATVRTGGDKLFNFMPGVEMIGTVNDSDHTAISVAGYTQQSAGTTAAHRAIGGSTNGNYVLLTIALRDDGNGDIVGQVDPDTTPATPIHILAAAGSGPYSGDLQGAERTADPTTLVNSLDGATAYKAISAGTIIYNTGLYAPRCANLNVNSALDYGTTQVARTQLASAQDLSDSLISVVALSDPDIAPYSSGGMYFGLINGTTTGARVWKLGALDTAVSPGLGTYPYVIDTGESGYASFGTVDLTSVSHLVLGSNVDGTAPGQFAWAYKLNMMVLSGGCADYVCSFSSAARAAKSAGLLSIQTQGNQAQSQFYAHQSMQIGTGGTTKPVYWDSTGQHLEFPSAADTSARRVHAQLGSGAVGLTLYAGANDTLTLNQTTVNGGGIGYFTIDASFNSSATVSTSGLLLFNLSSVTLNDTGSALSGITISQCPEVTQNSADLSGGCTIDATTGSQAITISGATQAALQTQLTALNNCTFSGNAVAIRIEYTGTGDITLNHSGASFTGNTVDYHYNSTNASALTINLQGGNNASTSAFSGSATGVTLSNDVTFTVNISETGAELTILTTGTQTEQHHVETAGTSEAFTFTAPLGVNVDIQVFKPGFIRYWEENRDLGTTASSITVNLESDLAYAA